MPEEIGFGDYFLGIAVRVIFVELTLDIAFDEGVCDANEEAWVDVVDHVHSDQLVDTRNGLVKLQSLDAEEDVVVPNLPGFPVDFESLFAAGDRLEVLFHGNLTAGEVGPGVSFAVVDGNDLAERIRGLFVLLDFHVGAPKGKPGVRIKSIDGEPLLVALDGLLELVQLEVVPAEVPHRLRALVA